MRRRIQISIWTAVTALVFASLAGGVTTSWFRGGVPDTLFTVAAKTQTQMVFEQGFSPILRNRAPAVVNIWTSRIVQMPDFTDPLSRRFLSRSERSLGSGVVVNGGGYVLTNHHLIEGATDVKVAISDNQEVDARVLGIDPPSDIAVLKINESGLAALTFADSDQVEVGDLALAIGNPFGIGRTVTMGIVSATGRGGFGIEDYENFIQTDAAINPGNSGGALININGELIGINTAILGPAGANLGIGFAIPSNMARNVLEQIIRNGEVVRGWLGVGIRDSESGVLITEVASGGPAAQAGLQVGDIIQEVDGERMDDVRKLRLTVSDMPPGREIHIRVSRAGPSRDFSLKVGRFPDRSPTEEPRFH